MAIMDSTGNTTVAAINTARAANVSAGLPATAGAGATATNPDPTLNTNLYGGGAITASGTISQNGTTPVVASTIGTRPVVVPQRPVSTTAAGISGIASSLVGQADQALQSAQQKQDQSTSDLTDVMNKIVNLQQGQVGAEAAAGLPQKAMAATQAANAVRASQQAQTNEIQSLEGKGLTDVQRAQAEREINHRYALDQANLSVTLAAANADYTTAANLIQHKLELQLAPLQTQKDFLTTFYNANKDILTKAQSNAFETKIQQATQQFDFAKVQYTDLTNFQKSVITNPGVPANVVNAVMAAKDLPSATAAAGEWGQAGKFTTASDAYGNPLSFNPRTGKYYDQSGAEYRGQPFTTTPSPTQPTPTASSTTTVASTTGTGTGTNKLSVAQYGLLANTDLNPKNQKDQAAMNYIDLYIKNGRVPTAYELGRQLKPAAMWDLGQRARDLYFQATGNNLPNPEIIKANQQLVANNNKLANNLKLQEQTVSANVDLSLANIKKNDLNSSGFKPLDSFLNTIDDMFQDPNVGQLIAQNSTIQNELGSLLAVKNASGTTVYDKLQSAGIITSSDSEAVIKQKVGALLSEAANFASSINSANAELYKQIDPLMQDPNNPLRQATLNAQKTGNPASAQITQANTKIDGLNVTIGNQSFTLPNQAAVDKFKADHNLK